MASSGKSNVVDGLLDPPGKAFEINNDSSTRIPLVSTSQERDVHAPPTINVNDKSSAFNMNDNLRRSVTDNQGNTTVLRFDAQGNVSARQIDTAKGDRDIVGFNKDGSPNSERAGKAGTQLHDVQPDPEDRITKEQNANGSTSISWMKGQTRTELAYNRAGMLESERNDTTTNEGITTHQVDFGTSAENAGKPTSVRDAKWDSHRALRFEHSRTLGTDTSITFGEHGDFHAKCVDQYAQYGSIARIFDPSSQKTEVVDGKADGSRLSTARFAGRPGEVYKTKVDANGKYVTQRINLKTGDRSVQEQGNLIFSE
jgi:hypothetical protein